MSKEHSQIQIRDAIIEHNRIQYPDYQPGTNGVHTLLPVTRSTPDNIRQVIAAAAVRAIHHTYPDGLGGTTYPVKEANTAAAYIQALSQGLLLLLAQDPEGYLLTAAIGMHNHSGFLTIPELGKVGKEPQYGQNGCSIIPKNLLLSRIDHAEEYGVPTGPFMISYVRADKHGYKKQNKGGVLSLYNKVKNMLLSIKFGYKVANVSEELYPGGQAIQTIMNKYGGAIPSCLLPMYRMGKVTNLLGMHVPRKNHQYDELINKSQVFLPNSVTKDSLFMSMLNELFPRLNIQQDESHASKNNQTLTGSGNISTHRNVATVLHFVPTNWQVQQNVDLYTPHIEEPCRIVYVDVSTNESRSHLVDRLKNEGYCLTGIFPSAFQIEGSIRLSLVFVKMNTGKDDYFPAEIITHRKPETRQFLQHAHKQLINQLQ